MKTQLGSHKIGKCLLASALVGGVAFAGVPTLTMTAFAEETDTETTTGGETQTPSSEVTVPVADIVKAWLTAIGASKDSEPLLEAYLTEEKDDNTAITWAKFCDLGSTTLNDPDTFSDFINDTNATSIANEVLKLYQTAGDTTASIDDWNIAVENNTGGYDTGSEDELDGIDVQLVNKLTAYNGGAITDFGTYVSFTANFKVTSSTQAIATWDLPKEYADKGCTIVNSGMLAPEVILTSEPLSDDDEQQAIDETDGTDPEQQAIDETDATQQAAADDAADEEEAEDTDVKPTVLDAYISDDGKQLVVQLPVSDGVTTLEGTISFATHTDTTKTEDGTVLVNYFRAKDSDGAFNYVKDFSVDAGEVDTKKYDKANVGYRNSLAGKKFTITFDSQGGSEVAAKQMDELTETTAAHLSTTLPTKSGSTFVGWYLDKDGKTPMDPFQMKAEDITAYAKWQVNAEPKVVPAATNTNPGTPVTTTPQKMSSTGDEAPAGAIFAGLIAVIAAGAAAARRR